MAARALEANGASKVYIIGRRLDVLEKAAKSSVSTSTPHPYLATNPPSNTSF
jgi:NADP-dependent 3-hydroxy acid dehydrogenase YdfG